MYKEGEGAPICIKGFSIGIAPRLKRELVRYIPPLTFAC